MVGQRYRVIQWSTGNIGARALRAVIDHPDYDLAGLWVSSESKLGRDAGVLCGTAASGIIASNDSDAMVALNADCVLYMRQGTDIDELCRLLASGKNVVTTRGDFHHPASMPPVVRGQIEQACAAGQSSIYSTGSSPGFITEALLLPLLSLSRRLDRLTIDEYGDVSTRNSPELLFNVMGFGKQVGKFDQRSADHVKQDFAASLAQTADAHGIAIDRWDAVGEYAAAAETVSIAAGTIEAGTMAAQRITITGSKTGMARLQFRANWFVTRAIDRPDWALLPSGWRVAVQGDTPLEVTIGFPVSPEDYAAFTPGLTAHRAVNAIPAVCAAPPGIVTTANLPNIIARLS